MKNIATKILLSLLIILCTHRLYSQYDTGYVARDINQMEQFNLYPSYDVYVQMMERFAANYPEICSLVEIGKSVENRRILAVKISDNVNKQEYNEPEFLYSSTIHGDELCGFNLMLRLIDHLLKNYNSDSYITQLINNVQIYINPLANPDGTYWGGNLFVTKSTRYNANGEDLNRSFPKITEPTTEPLQPEVQCMVDFAKQHYFSISANLHSGSEILNYPWDSFFAYEMPLPDNSWFIQICKKYVDTAHQIDAEYMISDIGPEGYVFGSEWYKIDGGRQDYMNYYHRCREITIELSNDYVLHPDYLDEYWNKNRQSLINLIGESLQGIMGNVTNIYGESIPNAEIFVVDKDKTYSTVFTNEEGYYFRYLPTDSIYEIAAYSDGYQTANQVVKTEKDQLVTLNFMLQKGESIYPLPSDESNNDEEPVLTVSSLGGMLQLSSTVTINSVIMVATDGKIVTKFHPNTNKTEYSVNNCSQGVYVIKADCGGRIFTNKIFLSK